MYLENVWRANLSITGCDGLPPISTAGNVLRSSTSVRLSMRLSPIQSVDESIKIITDKVTKDVPYGAQVKILRTNGGPGWC